MTSWYSAHPGVALGSMLPDFEHMCGGKVVDPADPDIAEGIALHHRTDKAFHCLDSFSELESHANTRLGQRGVARGSAMGTAHVAVELLLDGVLLDNSRACALYLAALDHQAPDIVWAKPEQGRRWHALRARLYDHGVPEGYRDPDTVAHRVTQVLSRYPSLALSQRDQAVVREEMGPLQERVAAGAAALLDELRAAMRDNE